MAVEERLAANSACVGSTEKVFELMPNFGEAQRCRKIFIIQRLKELLHLSSKLLLEVKFRWVPRLLSNLELKC